MTPTRRMSSPGFEILVFANEILNCRNRNRNEPLEADKNSLDWWRAKKKEYQTKYLREPGTSTQAERVVPEQEEAEHVKGDRVHATFLER